MISKSYQQVFVARFMIIFLNIFWNSENCYNLCVVINLQWTLIHLYVLTCTPYTSPFLTLLPPEFSYTNDGKF